MLKKQFANGYHLYISRVYLLLHLIEVKSFQKWSDIEKDSSVNIEIYFGDPGSPGQRGLNENSNGIVRKDLPKSTDLSAYSQEELNMIAYKWNSIPRKSLDYKTPNEVIKEATGFESLLTFA